MKKLFLILAAFLAVAMPKASEAVNVEGMYVGGLAGFNWLTSTKSHSHNNFKAGWIGGLDVGYRWCGGYRAEFEASYRSNKPKHSNHAVEVWSFMANGYWEVTDCWCITPYVGAGIGYDTGKNRRHHHHHDVVVGAAPVSDHHHHHKNKENGFAWQLIAGGLYDIDECMEMGVEYRFHKNHLKNLYNNTVDFRINWFF